MTINSYAGDDIRGVGGEVVVNGKVQGDLALLAGNVSVGARATVHGNVILAGGVININGNIQGNLKCKGDAININGKANQNIKCTGEKVYINGVIIGKSSIAAKQINIGNNAAFYHDINYWCSKKPDFGQSLKNSNALFDPSLKIVTSKWYYLGFTSLLAGLWYIGVVFVFILLIQYLFSNIMRIAAEKVFKQSVKSLAYGLLYFIGIPVTALILMLTLIGIPLSILIIFIYALLAIMSIIISSVVTANWINNMYAYKWNNWTLSLIGLLVYIVLKFLSLTPVFGWFIMIMISCIAFGAILNTVYQMRKGKVSIS